jgi:hypothetical protein
MIAALVTTWFFTVPGDNLNLPVRYRGDDINSSRAACQAAKEWKDNPGERYVCMKRACEGELDSSPNLWEVEECTTPDKRVHDVCGSRPGSCRVRVEGYGYWVSKESFFIKRLSSVRKVKAKEGNKVPAKYRK